MTGHVLTVVSASVDPAREDDLVEAYQAILQEDLPDGLLASALLRAADHQWQIATLWRSRAALDAMRAASEPPAALRVFRGVGAQPALAVFDVVNGISVVG